MPLALICSQADLEPDLAHTVLWRDGIERHTATSLDQARMMALAARPDVVLVDRDLPRASALVSALRQDPSTRQVSVAVVARGDFDTTEVELLEAGANAVLRLPPGADWDQRLMRLFEVPARREARFPVSFTVQALLLAGEPVNGNALNVSRNGILIETRLGALEVGTELELELSLPGSETIEVHGRAVRQAGPGQFGIQFLRVGDAAQRKIDAFVQSAAAA